MERSQNPVSRKESPGDSDIGVVIPVQLATLNILAALFKEGPKSTIEEALKNDPLLSGFMEDHFDQGTELLKDRYAIFRESLHKLTGNKMVKIAVGEDVINMPDGSDGNKGKAKVDEMDDDEVNKEMDDDEVEVDEHMDNDDVEQVSMVDTSDSDESFYKGYVEQNLSPIEEISNNPFIGPLADRVSNDEELNDISTELLETLRNVDVTAKNLIAQQHYQRVSQLVSQFWNSAAFRNGFYEELLKSYYVWSDMTYFATMVVIEKGSHEEKVDRIKKDPSFEKLLDEKDCVVRMRGILGIVIGYWIENDVLLAMVEEINARDNNPEVLKLRLKRWLG